MEIFRTRNSHSRHISAAVDFLAIQNLPNCVGDPSCDSDLVPCAIRNFFDVVGQSGVELSSRVRIKKTNVLPQDGIEESPSAPELSMGCPNLSEINPIKNDSN